ncbi:MAG: CHAD domain-containing protein, partial [Azoarcus sp.]|nr:CHAD domain-containing protein [Azoarcus sp.]
AEDLPLLPDDRSKAERGYRLHSGKPPRPLRAAASAITPHMDPLQAFSTLAFSCLRQWQANATGALAHEGPEFIHQLRVSQRRLRSLMRVFRAVLPEGFAADWSARLKNNAERFGEARDLDVLDEELLAPIATWSETETARLARLRKTIADARMQARAHAEKALDAAEQGRLLLALAEALMRLPGNDLIDSVDLRGFAALQLERLRKRARRRHRAALDRAPEHLHALRIAFKQLRYAVEFFAPLLPRKGVRNYLAALANTQNALGFIHDLDIARERFAALASTDAELDAATAYVCGWHGPRYAELTEAALADSRALLKVDKAPWAKLCRAHGA